MGYPAPATGGLAPTCQAILASAGAAALWASTHTRGGPGPTYAPDVANDEDKTILVGNGHTPGPLGEMGPRTGRANHAASMGETTAHAESSALRTYMTMPGNEYVCKAS